MIDNYNFPPGKVVKTQAGSNENSRNNSVVDVNNGQVKIDKSNKTMNIFEYKQI